MQTPPIPENEIKRLIALKQLDLLDTESEAAFDDITNLASLICGTPISLISLVDESRQWFKSSFGLDLTEATRDISFCGHAILGTDIFEIENAQLDKRFSDNPLVTSEPKIRFYAGVPLVTNGGYALGTLCVIDRVSRKLTDEQREALYKLAKQVILLFEHRLNLMQIEEMSQMLESTGRIAMVGGWDMSILDKKPHWTKEVYAIHEIDPSLPPPDLEEAINFYAPEARPIIADVVEQAIKSGEKWDLELPFITAKGKHIWVRSQGSAIYKNGKVDRLIGAFQEITARKKSEADLAWLNRALMMLSECNETLIHIKDEKKLITEICRVVVDVGGFTMAWVGYAKDDEYKLIEPQGYFGKTHNFLDGLRLSWDDKHPNGIGPGGRTIRTGLPIIVDDIMADVTYPAREHAKQQGYLSLISLPLKENDKTYGLLAMYAGEVREFKEDEIRLMRDLADNLADGIIKIRAEIERQRLNKAIFNLAHSVSLSRSEAFFELLVRNVTDTLDAQAGYVARFINKIPLKGQTLAALVDDEQVANYTYTIPDDTIADLFDESDLKIVFSGASLLFPTLSMMRFHPFQAFAGVRLRDSLNEDIGLLFVFFKESIDKKSADLITATLNIFAARTASELERLRSDAKVHEQASLLDKTRDAIVVRDVNHRVTFWNKGAEVLYGWSEAEVLNKPVNELFRHNPLVFEAAVKELMEKDEWNGELEEYHQNGKKMTIEAHWTLVRDQFGEPSSIFAIKSNISSRKLIEEEIRQLAFYDTLTKLPNRRLLLDRLDKSIIASKRSKLFGALMFIDLDNFKSLNDTHGHDKGDKLLREVADRLTTCVRECDTVSRFGGDEFVVMLEGLSQNESTAKNQAERVAKKIVKQLNVTFDFGGFEHLSTPSIGVTIYNHEAKSIKNILKLADVAMYKSKAEGRNRYTFS